MQLTILKNLARRLLEGGDHDTLLVDFSDSELQAMNNYIRAALKSLPDSSIEEFVSHINSKPAWLATSSEDKIVFCMVFSMLNSIHGLVIADRALSLKSKK